MPDIFPSEILYSLFDGRYGLHADVDALKQGQSAGVLAYTTKALLDANLVPSANTPAIVTNDPDPANNTYFIKVGGVGVGSWQRSAVIPQLYLPVSGYASLTAAVAAIGSTPATLVINAATTCTANTTIPATLAIETVFTGSINQGAYTLTVTGPFRAGMYQVFAGSGSVTFGAGTTTAHPEWWPADSTGVAIQSAINSLTAGDVQLAANKTYTLNRRVPMTMVGGAPACDAMLIPKSGVNVIGHGRSSVLKVVNGFSTAGDYVVFGTQNLESVNYSTFRDFQIDGNGLNNLHPGGGAIRRACAFWLFDSLGVIIEQMTFTNNPGLNTIKLGNDNLTYQARNAKVINNYFFGQGGAVVGNRNQPDHSTMYISGYDIEVSKNTMYGAATPIDEDTAPSIVVAALEMHGQNIRITQNYIENYGAIGYSVSDNVQVSTGHLWDGNQCMNITKIGISLWSLTELSDVVIINNKIRIYSTTNQAVAGIYQSALAPDTTIGVKGLRISKNMISGNNTSPSTVWHGVLLTAVSDFVITDNRISTISTSGIILQNHGSLPLNIEDGIITDNVFTDNNLQGIGYALNITNAGTGKYQNIYVDRNLIVNNQATTRAAMGIIAQGGGFVTGVILGGNNQFRGLPDKTSWIVPNGTLFLSGDIKVVPTVHQLLYGNPVPDKGVYVGTTDIFKYYLASAGTKFGAIVVTAGGGYSATRANTTAYTVGTWVKTGAGKILECITAGTTGTGDPAPTVLGTQSTDGTVVWVYRSATPVVLKSFGAVDA